MKKLEFSYNWNRKLFNKVFTTIRKKEWMVCGDMVEVYLEEKYICKAQVIGKQKITLSQLRQKEYLCHLDTGYSAKETCDKIIPRMYDNVSENTEFTIYLLKEVSREGVQDDRDD
jgi:hypothetical protein